MKLSDLKESTNKFDLYIPDPYGNGFEKEPVKVGEVLPLLDGNEVEFLGITDDGKKLIVKINGKRATLDPEQQGFEIVPKGAKH